MEEGITYEPRGEASEIHPADTLMSGCRPPHREEMHFIVLAAQPCSTLSWQPGELVQPSSCLSAPPLALLSVAPKEQLPSKRLRHHARCLAMGLSHLLCQDPSTGNTSGNTSVSLLSHLGGCVPSTQTPHYRQSPAPVGPQCTCLYSCWCHLGRWITLQILAHRFSINKQEVGSENLYFYQVPM